MVLHGKSCLSIAKSKLGMWHFLQLFNYNFLSKQFSMLQFSILQLQFSIKTIPHLGNQAKFVSLSPLPPTKKVIESQMFHDFLIPITAHGIFKD